MCSFLSWNRIRSTCPKELGIQKGQLHRFGAKKCEVIFCLKLHRTCSFEVLFEDWQKQSWLIMGQIWNNCLRQQKVRKGIKSLQDFSLSLILFTLCRVCSIKEFWVIKHKALGRFERTTGQKIMNLVFFMYFYQKILNAYPFKVI